MKKKLSSTVIALLLFGAGAMAQTAKKPNRLNGTWVPQKQEMGGKEMPAATFAKQKLVMNDSNYTVVAESVDKGIIRIKGDKMDIYGKDGVNAGKHFTAIFKHTEKELTICYNLAGDSYPQAFETKSKPTLFLSVFKKE